MSLPQVVFSSNLKSGDGHLRPEDVKTILESKKEVMLELLLLLQDYI